MILAEFLGTSNWTPYKVSERLGHLKAACPAVWKDYRIDYHCNERNIITSFQWKRIESRSLCTENKHGKYVLRTNLDETAEEDIWSFYNVIRTVEETFRCLKTDLDIRPVYHKSDDGVKAHLNLAVLAYWVVSTINYQLRQAGIHQSWSETKRVFETQKVVSSQVMKEDQRVVEIRQCTEPSENVRTLYRILKITETPLRRRRKFVVHPDRPPDKLIKSVRPYRRE